MKFFQSNSTSSWIVIFIAMTSLLMYSYLTSLLKRNMKITEPTMGNNVVAIYLQRLVGVVTFGVIPFLTVLFLDVSVLNGYGLIMSRPLKSLIWIISLTFIIVPICIYWGNTPVNLSIYPQIRTNKWNLRILVCSALSWTTYLFCYEFFFRGFLLFSCERGLGVQNAVIINTLFYALAHFPKGKVETIGAIPFGLILCLATFSTGSIWAAFGVHLVMALSTEWISLYYHKEMKIILLRN